MIRFFFQLCCDEQCELQILRDTYDVRIWLFGRKGTEKPPVDPDCHVERGVWSVSSGWKCTSAPKIHFLTLLQCAMPAEILHDSIVRVRPYGLVSLWRALVSGGQSGYEIDLRGLDQTGRFRSTWGSGRICIGDQDLEDSNLGSVNGDRIVHLATV